VHEGPQRFRKTNHVPLEPGMVSSCEPGVYVEGAFGVRLENTIATVPSTTTAFGPGRPASAPATSRSRHAAPGITTLGHCLPPGGHGSMDERTTDTTASEPLHLVIGASGALGSRVTRRLLAEGGRVRASSRDPARLAALTEAGAAPVRLDLLDPDTFAAALEGVDHVVIAAHGLVPPSRRNTPAAVDGEGARRLIDAAAQVGVRRVVFVSVADADREATIFARVKRATERHLERAGVPWTVLRPSVFVENHALLLLGEPLQAGKPVPFFGSGTEPLNWISADDVAAEIVRALHDPAAAGAVRELRGVDRMSRRDALALLERTLGKTAKRQHLPVPVVRALRAVTGALHPGVHTLLDMVLHEIARGGDPADAAERADAVGPTRVADVVAAWVRGDAASGATAAH
jgi:uncharacterized protein YbjT (DUF2867 family)